MKTAIIYYSAHHGNTKKLLDAIAEKNDVTLIDAVDPKEVDLENYDLIGFASGIYYSKFHKSVIEFAKKHLPANKRIFFIYTYGGAGSSKSVKNEIGDKNPIIVGEYGCKGFDTFGPFKLVGGVAKGHPTQDEIDKACVFYSDLVRKTEA